MNEQIQLEKEHLRKKIYDLTLGLTDEYIQSSNRGIEAYVKTLAQWKQAHTICIYVSTQREPRTHGIIEAALSQGKEVAVPRCRAAGMMDAHIITSLEELQQGRYCILEPKASNRVVSPDSFDLMIAPCVTADRQGNRLGRGAGYYDRYLPQVHCDIICLCREALLQDTVPQGVNDHPVDLVITEKGIYPI